MFIDVGIVMGKGVNIIGVRMRMMYLCYFRKYFVIEVFIGLEEIVFVELVGFWCLFFEFLVVFLFMVLEER